MYCTEILWIIKISDILVSNDKIIYPLLPILLTSFPVLAKSVHHEVTFPFGTQLAFA